MFFVFVCCIYYGSPLDAAATLPGIKAVYTIFKTLQYIHRFHNTLCALRPLLHHYHISTVLNTFVCIVCMLLCVCVYACVCANVCVASQSHCSIKVLFNVFFFKSNFTACVSYLMWNGVPCSHGSMKFCVPPIVCFVLVNCDSFEPGEIHMHIVNISSLCTSK